MILVISIWNTVWIREAVLYIYLGKKLRVRPHVAAVLAATDKTVQKQKAPPPPPPGRVYIDIYKEM